MNIGKNQRGQLLNRLVGVLRFDTSTLDDIKNDKDATGAAVGIVILVATTGWFAAGAPIPTLPGYILARSAWFMVGVFMVYALGTTIFQTGSGQATWGQIFRTLGFAQGPAAVQVLGVIHGMDSVVYISIFAVANLWRFGAMTASVRHVLAFESNLRAILVVGISFVPWLAIEILLQPVT